MGITLPTETQLQEQGQAYAGGVVMDDTDNDWETFIQRQHRNYGQNTRHILARGAYAPGISETGAGYTVRYIGRVRLINTTVRLRFYIYAANVDMKITVGGVALAVVLIGAKGWASNASASIAGITLDADGYAVFQVEGRKNVVNGDHFRWLLTEEPMVVGDLPDASAVTDFQKLDDKAGAPDHVVDTWLGQTLEINATETLVQRTRGTCQCWPIDFPLQLSSGYRRAMGPFNLAASPWCDSIDMSVSGAAVDDGVVTEDMTLWGFTLGESTEVALAREVTIAPTAVAHSKFHGMRSENKRGEAVQNSAYLGFVTDSVGSSLGNATFTDSFSDGQFRIATNPFTALGPDTHGRFLKATGLNGANLDGTGKPSFTGGEVFEGYDLASSDTDWATANYIRLSPQPGVIGSSSGLTGGLTTNVQLSIHPIAIYNLYSVWVNESATIAPNQKEDWPDQRPPPSTTMKSIRDNTKLASTYGTPQIALCPEGQRANGSAAGNTQRGIWRFIESTSGPTVFRDACVWSLSDTYIPAAPSAAAVVADQWLAQCPFMVIRIENMHLGVAPMPITWRLAWSSSPDEDLTDATKLTSNVAETAGAPMTNLQTVQQSVTLSDMFGAATTLVRHAAVDYDHAYTNQVALFSELMSGLPFNASPELGLDIPAVGVGYPGFLKLQVSFTPLTGLNSWVVVPGGSAWYSKRL